MHQYTEHLNKTNNITVDTNNTALYCIHKQKCKEEFVKMGIQAACVNKDIPLEVVIKHKNNTDIKYKQCCCEGMKITNKLYV